MEATKILLFTLCGLAVTQNGANHTLESGVWISGQLWLEQFVHLRNNV